MENCARPGRLSDPQTRCLAEDENSLLNSYGSLRGERYLDAECLGGVLEKCPKALMGIPATGVPPSEFRDHRGRSQLSEPEFWKVERLMSLNGIRGRLNGPTPLFLST